MVGSRGTFWYVIGHNKATKQAREREQDCDEGSSRVRPLRSELRSL
jgi:hypothetical protein